MCGIAGLFSKSLDVSENLGGHLGAMLLQLSDRGPDSAGVAIYRDPAPAGSSKVSLFSPDRDQDWGAVRDELAERFGAGEPEVRATPRGDRRRGRGRDAPRTGCASTTPSCA